MGSDVSICNWDSEVVKTGNWFEGTSFWNRSRAVCALSRHSRTHPWLFRGRVNRKLSVNLLRRRGCDRLGHWVFSVTHGPFRPRPNGVYAAEVRRRTNGLSANDAWVGTGPAKKGELARWSVSRRLAGWE